LAGIQPLGHEAKSNPAIALVGTLPVVMEAIAAANVAAVELPSETIRLKSAIIALASIVVPLFKVNGGEEKYCASAGAEHSRSRAKEITFFDKIVTPLSSGGSRFAPPQFHR
jgi:hypothetical protein